MKKRKFPPFLRVILLILAGVVLGVNLYSWNAKSLSGNVMPMPFGYGAAVVLSGSMEPTIMTDELIIVHAQEDYEVGDVVVYQAGYMLVVHRIVDMDGQTVTTRGDANNTDDAPMKTSSIKGKVIAHIPHVGAVVRVIKTPVFTILLIAGAILTIELPFRKKKEQDDEQLQKIKEEIQRLKEEQSQ